MQSYTYLTYRTIRKSLICALFLAAAMLPAQQAHASILSVTALPASHNVTVNHTASVAIMWNVTGGGQGPLGPVVSSQQSFFGIQGGQGFIILKNVNTPLSKTNPGSASLLIREQLLIPASVIAKARKLGAIQFSYVRNFNDGNLPKSGTITFNITGSAGAGFNISREALSFTDK